MIKPKDALHASNVQSIKTTNSLISTDANHWILESCIKLLSLGALVGSVIYGLKHGKNVEFGYGNFSFKTY